MLELQHISKHYPGVKALDKVSLSIKEGEVHAICGENGAGKSTLMNIISGSVIPNEGKIWLKGQQLRCKNPKEAYEKGIAIVHQERSLINSLSIAENVFAGRAPRNKWGLIQRKKLYTQTQKLLQELGLTSLSPTRQVATLSAAQKQMVEIAKALSVNPDVLILDEPTSSVGEKETQLLFDILKDLKQKGKAIIYISHRMAEIFQIADTITVLKDGQHQGTFHAHELNQSALIKLMVGRELTASQFPSYRQKEVMLEVEGLSGEGFNDISFQISKGEIFGWAGLVGAGRTELAMAIFGATPFMLGKLCLDGLQYQFHHPREAVEAGIAYVPEERKSLGVFLENSILENIQAVQLNQSFWMSPDTKTQATTLQKKLQIKTPSLSQKVGLLSGGNQQKVLLAKWLATQPRLLIVDEPTHGIDVGAKAEIYQILKELAEEGLSIMLISSELPELLLMADRIGVMKEGRLVDIVDKAEASEERLLKLAT